MPKSYKPLLRILRHNNIKMTQVYNEVYARYGIIIPRGTKAAMLRGDPIDPEWIEKICEVLNVSAENVVEQIEDKTELDYGDYTVAIMGRCGSGKSTLINALIHTDFKTSTVEEGTKQLQSAHVEIDGLNVCFVDSPGTGANSENDIKYMSLYKELLSHADCIVWVLQANVRADTGWQRMILQLKEHIKTGCNIIFCVNQADKLGSCVLERGLTDFSPDELILKALEDRCQEVFDRAKEVCFMPTAGTVLPCSAVKNYNLDRLYQMIFNKNPDLHTAPKQSIIKSLQIRSDIDEQSEQIKETNTVG